MAKPLGLPKSLLFHSNPRIPFFGRDAPLEVFLAVVVPSICFRGFASLHDSEQEYYYRGVMDLLILYIIDVII